MSRRAIGSRMGRPLSEENRTARNVQGTMCAGYVETGFPLPALTDNHHLRRPDIYKDSKGIWREKKTQRFAMSPHKRRLLEKGPRA